MREFTTATKDPLEDDVIEVPIRRNPDIDPTDVPELFVLKAHRPSDGQLALLMASIGKGASEIDGIAGPMNFFDTLLDDDGRRYVTDRLFDRRDQFGPDNIIEIMEALVEEWGGRPTQPSSGSTASQPTDGQNSTQPTQPQTSSGSLLTGS